MLPTSTYGLKTRLGALLGTTLLLAAASHSAQAQLAWGLAGNNLISFNASSPGTILSGVALSGVTDGQTVVGMDFRPNTGQLFALGYNATTKQAQVYTVATNSGVVTAAGAAITLDLGTATDRIGFDFNPTVDRIRVVSSNRANFRLNPNNGALAATDGTLTYATTDPNASQTPGVGAGAYTNSYIGTAATTLYNIDEINSRLVTQVPPNDGTLNTVGPLGVATNGATQSADLDIYFNATTNTNTAYMSLATGNASALYTVNLTSGAATLVGNIGSNLAVRDITFQITRNVPANVTGQLVYGLVNAGAVPALTSNLVTFDSNQPGIIRSLVAVTGLDANQSIVGMDIRPATNSIYALGYNATAQTGQIYTINAATGAARAINATPVALALGTGKVSFDFNPTVDLIRIVGRNRVNYRVSPVTGAITATDGQLAFAAGDPNASQTPNIGAVAYTNSFATATATTLYDYDLNLNVLAIQNPPNNGTLNTVGSSGLTVNATTPNVDMDVYYNPATATNTAYLVANPGTTTNTNLYTINVATGATTLVGPIGNGVPVRDIAITGPGGVTSTNRALAASAALQLYPNPATEATTVSFTLTQPTQVELAVFDALGRQVAVLHSGLLRAGTQEVRWNPAAAPKGVYFVRLTLDGQAAGTQRGLVVN